MNATTGRGQAELVLVHIGPWRVALPRRDVRDLVSPQDLDTGALASGGGVGARFGSRDVPVLLLDDELRPTRRMLAGRRICVVLDAEGFLFGLLCDEFRHHIVAPDGGLTLHELASTMRAPGSPAKAVLQYGNAVAAVTDAQALLTAFEAPLSRVMEAA